MSNGSKCRTDSGRVCSVKKIGTIAGSTHAWPKIEAVSDSKEHHKVASDIKHMTSPVMTSCDHHIENSTRHKPQHKSTYKEHSLARNVLNPLQQDGHQLFHR